MRDAPIMIQGSLAPELERRRLLLLEELRSLQEEAREKAKPVLDRLAEIENLRSPPKWIIPADVSFCALI